MANDRTYEIAGTSYGKGVMTYRFADGKISVRAGVLRRCGATDVEFFQLPHPMTKLQAIEWLKANGHSRNAVLPHGHRLTKNPKKVRGDVEPAPVAPVKTAEEVAAEMAAAKLAAKRARDAERKRAKRAAARAAKAQVAEAA